MKRAAFDPLNYPGHLSLYEIESRAAEAVIASEELTEEKVTIRVRVVPFDALPPELKTQSRRSRPRRH
jgi:hypothetical protein